MSKDGFLAVGSYSPGNKKAEQYNFETDSWRVVEDYPFGSGQYLSAHEMLYIEETQSYLVIGGYSGGKLNQIAKFQDGSWFDAGQLNSPRQVSFC